VGVADLDVDKARGAVRHAYRLARGAVTAHLLRRGRSARWHVCHRCGRRSMRCRVLRCAGDHRQSVAGATTPSGPSMRGARDHGNGGGDCSRCLARRPGGRSCVLHRHTGSAALINELVDWFALSLRGGCRRKEPVPPDSHVTPDTVWALRVHRRAGGQRDFTEIFNSFLDGTKSAIEMARWPTRPAAAAYRVAVPPVDVDELATCTSEGSVAS